MGIAAETIVRGAPLTLPTAPLVHRFLAHGIARANDVAYHVYPHGATTASTLTWGEWREHAQSLAAELLARGVRRGDRVVIFAGNGRCWPIADMAVAMIGAIGAGIYPSSAAAQVAAMVADVSPVVAIADSLDRATLLRAAAHRNSQRLALAIDAPEADPEESLAHWLVRGAERLARDVEARGALDAVVADISLDDPAALIFTSGSTGVPKAAQLSHRYLAASAASIAEALQVSRGDSSLAFLPFSHAAERVFGHCVRIHAGIPGALVEHAGDVFTVARVFQPTIFGGLPRIFERLHEALVADLGTAGLSSLDRDPSVHLRARAILHMRVGGRCRVATSGGASLPITVSETMRAAGLPVLGAYGQTEHLCVCMNRPDDPTSDTVGPPMPGTSVRVAEDGELLVERGALTFDGYWRRQSETREAFTADGAWLRTGDSAEIDPRGYVRITGRIKELIALSTGRKIAPLPIESALAATPLIAQAVCIGEGRRYLTALVVLRRASAEEWAADRGISASWPQLAADTAVRAELQRAIEGVNESLALTDRVQRFAVVTEELSPENGLLTSTFKIVRQAVAERFASTIDGLYV